MSGVTALSNTRLLTRWTAVVAAVVVVVSIGLPLVGLRAFHGSDVLLGMDPWRSEVPTGTAAVRPPIADTVDAVVPFRKVFRDGVREGRFPLWNPYVSGGTALGAVPDAGMLSPLNLPYFVLPLWLAPGFAKLAELLVAIGFTFLFLRRLGVGRPAAMLGGLAFAYSGFQVVWTNWPQTHVGALVPALFWAVERYLQSPTRRSLVPIALVTAVMFVEGFPVVVGYAFLALVPYVLLRAVQLGEGRVRTVVTRIATVGLAGALGAGLVAVQLLPFWRRLDLLGLEQRSQAPEHHLPLEQLITTLVPNAFGSGIKGPYLAAGNVIENQSFLGVGVVVLAIAALAWPRARTIPVAIRGFFAAAAALSVVLGYVGGPLLGLFQRLPVFESNFVGRIRSVLGFFVAVLAAFGLERLLDRAPVVSSRRARAWLVGVAAATSAGVAFLFFEVLDDLRDRGQLWRSARLPALSLLVVIVAVVALRRVRRPGWRTAAAALIPVVVGVEALALALPFWPRIEPDRFYPQTATHQFLAKHLGYDRYVSHRVTMYPGSNAFYGLRAATGHAFTDARWKELLLAVDYSAFWTPTFSTLTVTPGIATSPGLDRMATRYLVMPPEAPVLGDTTVIGGPAGELVVASESSVRASVPGGPLRGVGVEVVRPAVVDDPWAAIEVEVRAGDGRVVARGRRRLFGDVTPGPLMVAVPSEGLAAGDPVEARVILRARGTALPIAAGADGQPVLTVVRPAVDGLRLVFVDGATVYERQNSLPRVRWASAMEIVPDTPTRLARLLSGVGPNIVVLERAGPAASGLPGAVRLLEDSGDAIEVEVHARGPGYLVVADAIQHGWRAELDGEPAVLRPADHAVVAVAVPAGRHRVEITYRPPGRQLGIIVSLVSVGVLVLLAAPVRRRPPAIVA